jgi:hypothetical protein
MQIFYTTKLGLPDQAKYVSKRQVQLVNARNEAAGATLDDVVHRKAYVLDMDK